MKPTLTKKQKEMLDFIKSFTKENEYPPTFREIMSGLDYSSVATVAQHIENLVNKGYLFKRDNEARSIQLADIEETDPDVTKRVALPILGYIAAGQPLTILDNPQETLEVPEFMIKSEHSYVLKVKGDSMIEDKILDGDYIVVREHKTPNNGDVVVAYIDREGATLKRYYHEGDKIRLQPANSTMEPIYVSPDQDFEVQGVVTGLVRAF